MTELAELIEVKPLDVDRHDPKILDALQEAPIYKKVGKVKAVLASGGER